VPELPEVEVVRLGLEQHVVGSTITAVDVLHPRPVRRHPAGPGDFADRLPGRTVEAVRRRGKFFWLALDYGDAVLGHLGMSGQMLVREPHAAPERHLRVRFLLTRGDPALSTHELRFVDQRMFGGLLVSAGGADLPAEIAHIARDPLDPGFDDAAFVAALRRRAAGVKRLLLDQSLVSGIGNIYADEALWRARLHWARPTERLTRAQGTTVLGAATEVMAEALRAGGTSFDALYVNINGQSGYFERSLNVYGRQDRPCRRCGTPVRREPFMNRSSYFCPRCQLKPRRSRYQSAQK
jgi:formamidopyrimidine-DNA glycosylase